MKKSRLLRVASALSITAVVAVACNTEYFELNKISSDSFSPTFAVPIADMDITIGQLVNRYAKDLENVYDPNYSSGSDSVFFLQIEYNDTLESIAGPSQDIPAGFPADPIVFDLDSVELNLFGELGGNDAFFRLLNPSIKFTYLNSIDKAFELEFDTLYTKKISNNQTYPFRVIESLSPFPIAKPATAGAVEESALELNNQTTASYNGSANPMTNVIEPTPKFIYYGSTLTPVGTDAMKAGGEMKLISTVLLPLEGFGSLNFVDTTSFEPVDTTYIAAVDEVLVRMLFTNGLPMDAEISVSIYDSTTWTKVYELPVYDENGLEKPNGAFVEAAETGTASNDYRPGEPTRFFSDIRMSADEFRQVMKGNAMIINADIFTTGFDRTSADHVNSKTIKMYTDYTIRVQLGLKTRLNIDPDLLTE
jgi:hypothetical protein